MSNFKDLRKLFEKKFEFQNNETFHFPSEVFTCKKWLISSLQSEKEELNRVKSLLNQFNLEEWSRHTKHRDPSSYITRFIKQKFHPELLTQAWCKFYECLCNYKIFSKTAVSQNALSSIHLCEAPGAFISALNHYIVSHDLNFEWSWYATSLNPDHEGNSPLEMIPDDRLLRHTYQNWFFGSDFTGNITRYYNHIDLLNKIQPKGKIWLVTADGSVDCSCDPGNQELHVGFLHYCETLTALALLYNGGTFVLKIFTMFEDSTICLLYLLNLVFKKVSLFKPASSKSGNSEVYVICIDYKGVQIMENIWESLLGPYKNGQFNSNCSMFALNQIDTNFLSQLTQISKYFMEKQIERITENIFYFKNTSQTESAKLHQIKIYVANRYINKYKLKSIPQNRRLVTALDISQFSVWNIKQYKFNDRIVKISVSNLIPTGVTNSILDIKLGERITQIKNSRFCPVDCLHKFTFSIKSSGLLYQNIEKSISKTCTVICLGDYNGNCFYEFQRSAFYKIFNSSKNNYVFIKIPLFTNFLVGLMYVLMSSYEQVYLHESGFIVLYNVDTKKLENTKHILEIINQTFASVNDCRLFHCDIAQIFAPNVLYNNNFFDFIWNYNNILFSKF